MILRDVIVGSEPERLRGSRAADLPNGQSLSVLRLAPVPLQDAPAPAAPALTAERVCEWLEVQSPEVRTACAGRLAAEIEALAESARKAALESGRAQGREEALESARSSLAALSRAVAGAEQALARECAGLAEGCADIVMEVFCKLAGPALVTREAALGAVLEVLKRVKDERALTLRVNPRDLPYLETQRGAIQEAIGSRTWTLGADPRVALGGCLVDSSLGTLDGRLESQLQELCATLRASKATGRGDE